MKEGKLLYEKKKNIWEAKPVESSSLISTLWCGYERGREHLVGVGYDTKVKTIFNWNTEIIKWSFEVP